MPKIIIQHDVDDDAHAIELVRKVVITYGLTTRPNKPRHYYTTTVFPSNKGNVVVTCNKRKNSGTLTFKVFIDSYKEKPIQIFIDDVVPPQENPNV